MSKIKYIHKLNENGKLRVCAYARISSIKEKQETSLNEQIEFYSGLILNNSSFDFIGIYADEGKSGTTLKKREQFVCMKDIPYSGFINFHNEFIKVHKCLYYTKYAGKNYVFDILKLSSRFLYFIIL